MTVLLRDQEVIVAAIKAFIFRLDLILIIAFFFFLWGKHSSFCILYDLF